MIKTSQGPEKSAETHIPKSVFGDWTLAQFIEQNQVRGLLGVGVGAGLGAGVPDVLSVPGAVKVRALERTIRTRG